MVRCNGSREKRCCTPLAPAAASVNPNLADIELPRQSLAGKIDTRHLNVSLVAQPLSRLRLSARYDRSERDNNTAQAIYDFVLTDLAVAGTRINIPLGFDRSDTTLQANYRLRRRTQLKLGAERTVTERSFQARARSEEQTQSFPGCVPLGVI